MAVEGSAPTLCKRNFFLIIMNERTYNIAVYRVSALPKKGIKEVLQRFLKLVFLKEQLV